EHEIDRILDRNPVPVRQDMRADEIDFGDQFGMLEPDIEGFRGTDRTPGTLLDFANIIDQLLHRNIVPEQHFVADHHPDDFILFWLLTCNRVSISWRFFSKSPSIQAPIVVFKPCLAASSGTLCKPFKTL